MQNEPSMLKPALISGLVFGIVAAIPILNFINCACCALIIGCGFLAAYLMSQEHRAAGLAFRAGNGATVGLVSGLVYGVVNGIVGAVVQLAFGVGDITQVLEQLESSGMDLDPQAMERISGFMASTGPLALALFGLFIAILLGAIFATIGGLIGGAVFKHQPTSSQV